MQTGWPTEMFSSLGGFPEEGLIESKCPVSHSSVGKMPCWCQRSEENGQAGVRWQKGKLKDISNNLQLQQQRTAAGWATAHTGSAQAGKRKLEKRCSEGSQLCVVRQRQAQKLVVPKGFFEHQQVDWQSGRADHHPSFSLEKESQVMQTVHVVEPFAVKSEGNWSEIRAVLKQAGPRTITKRKHRLKDESSLSFNTLKPEAGKEIKATKKPPAQFGNNSQKGFSKIQCLLHFFLSHRSE